MRSAVRDRGIQPSHLPRRKGREAVSASSTSRLDSVNVVAASPVDTWDAPASTTRNTSSASAGEGVDFSLLTPHSHSSPHIATFASPTGALPIIPASDPYQSIFDFLS